MAEKSGDVPTRWQLRVVEHPVQGRLADLRTAIGRLESRSDAATALDVLSRLRLAADRSQQALQNVDPELVTAPNLNSLQNGLSGTIASIEAQENQEASGVPLDWSAIDSDPPLDALGAWPRSGSPIAEDLREVTSRVDASRDEAVAILEGLRTKADSVAASMDASLTELLAHSDAASVSLETRQTDLDSRIAAQVELVGQQLPRLDAAITSQTETFNAGETQRRTQAEATIAALRADHGGMVAEFKSADDELRSTINTEADALFLRIGEQATGTQTLLDQKFEEAKDIVGVIARTGMTGGYQIYADRERADADRWRKVSVVIGVLAVAVLAGIVVWSGVDHNTTWALALGRLLLAGGLGGVSAYAARQSSQHRERSERARGLELSLASIGPYLEAIDDEDMKRKVLETFAYVFFAVPEGEKDSEAESGPSLLTTAIAAVATKVT